jgi:hypothetical protein
VQVNEDMELAIVTTALAILDGSPPAVEASRAREYRTLDARMLAAGRTCTVEEALDEEPNLSDT